MALLKKVIAVSIAIVLVLNIILLNIGLISDLAFWIIIAAGALIAYLISPRKQ